jgi:membrane protein
VFDLERLRRRWPRLDHGLSVHERFAAVGGGPHSSSIALAGFLSLFPLLLVLIAAIGFVSSGDSDFAATVVSDLGLQGRAAEVVENAITTAEGSRRAASVVGIVGLLWAGLAVVGALQNALNAAWQARGRGLLDRVVAVGWLLGAGTLFLLSVALGPALRWTPGSAKPLTLLAGLMLTTVLFLWTYHLLGNKNVGWRVHLPGALLVAVGFEILKVVGSVFVPRAIASASALYGAIGVVFATLAWFAIYGRLIVYGAVLNVVRYEHRAGTVTVTIEVPRIAGEVPLTTTRGGAVDVTRDAPGE